LCCCSCCSSSFAHGWSLIRRLRGFSSPLLLSSPLSYTRHVTQTRRYFVRLFSFALTTPEPRTRVHTHTQIGSWKKKIKKSCFKDPFEWEGKTKCFLGGKNQAGTAAAPDWVVVLTRRDTKRFHVTGSNTGCWLVVVVVVLRLFVVWFSALMVIGCWQFPVRLGAAQEKRGAETTPTRETS
jgi:hypothetical protein